MAFKKSKSSLLFNIQFLVISIIGLGAVVALSAINQPTQTKQYASQSVNLNTSDDIEKTNNTDGTMGPKTARDNFSEQLPNSYLGQLVLSLSNSNTDPSSEISSLKLTISKAELHLIYLYLPGSNSDNIQKEKINKNNKKTNQNVNKWETISADGESKPIEIDTKNGNQINLESARITGGKYSEIRLYISEAKATLKSGEEIDINLTGKNNVIRIQRPFNIYPSYVTYITLFIDAEKSIIKSGEDTYFLKPIISNITIKD